MTIDSSTVFLFMIIGFCITWWMHLIPMWSILERIEKSLKEIQDE